MKRGQLVVVSGPSGVGKDSILRRVFELDPNISYSISYTTRDPRPGEVDGVDYWFVDGGEFDRMVEAGELLEWEPVHNHRSGTGRAQVERVLDAGRDIALNIDVKGGVSVRGLFPEALLVFLAPPDMGELRRRLESRHTETQEEIARRAADAEIEMGYSDRYDAIVVNDQVDRAAAEVVDLIEARRGREA